MAKPKQIVTNGAGRAVPVQRITETTAYGSAPKNTVLADKLAEFLKRQEG